MAPRPPRSSPEATGPSAAAVVGPPAAAHPEPEPDKTADTASLVSQSREEDLVVGHVAAAQVTGGHENEGPLAQQEAEEADADVVAPEAELPPQIAEPVIQRFAPIKDVKTMLQTGLFEGKRIVYRNKRDKLDLLHGVIKGTSYFCLCGGYCNKTGKELSAKSFELHAKGESHNPNDHIFLDFSSVSLFEMSKKFKEAKDISMLQGIFNKTVLSDCPGQSLKKDSTAHGIPDQSLKMDTTVNENYPLIVRLELLEKRMEQVEKNVKMIEQIEKKVEQIDKIQSQVDTIEENIKFLVNETVRSQKTFEEVSKVFAKFSGQ